MQSFSTRKSSCTAQMYSEFDEINLRRYILTRAPVNINNQLKLALTSSAGCGRLVGIVRLRTKKKKKPRSMMNTKYDLHNFVGINSES
jgi:hypothetical protein